MIENSDYLLYEQDDSLFDEQNSSLLFWTGEIHDEILNTRKNLLHYTILLIQSGSGVLKFDLKEINFFSNCILFLAPYQTFLIQPSEKIQGVRIHFISEFYCIEKNNALISCSGLLFNNYYQSNLYRFSPEYFENFFQILKSIDSEIKNKDSMSREMIVCLLKTFLISVLRKQNLETLPTHSTEDNEEFIWSKFKVLLEDKFSDYKSLRNFAFELQTTETRLKSIIKNKSNSTFAKLLRQRILLEAKRKLTLRDDKIYEIAQSLGFEDPFYFSRFFKKFSGLSPENYRQKFRN
ncbi:MAG: helix-turn-helix domain-containing protein [Leptospiraceae bacterium]|nr:helix-turn-helix domain-containing protein [Leptospiraceae bacterium]